MQHSIWQRLLMAAAGVTLTVGLTACDSKSGDGDGSKEKVAIGVVAKSQSNAVFEAARAGAMDAAKELGPRYGVEVEIVWRTPPEEDAQKQAEFVEQLIADNVDGIAVSCSEATALTEAINKAVEAGIPVVTFDSDAPDSKRMCFYGTDDEACGKQVMAELASVMDGKGTIAILAGNQAAPNLQARVAGVKKELEEHPEMQLLSDGVFYHEETPEKAVEKLQQAQTAHGDQLDGWAMVGGWPLFTQNALNWEPGAVKVVAVDALPAQLTYLESGHVQALYAQDCYKWGSKSVELLLNKIVNDEDPPQERIIAPLQRVTQSTASDFRKQWEKWLSQ